MSFEEWSNEMEKTKISHGQTNYTRNSRSEEISRMDRRIFLLFNIGEWTYKRAEKGEEWALDALDYGLSTNEKYDKIIEKAKEENLI